MNSWIKTVIAAALLSIATVMWIDIAYGQEGEPEGEPVEMMIRNVGAVVKCINFRIPENINPARVGPEAIVRINYRVLDEYGDPVGDWLWCRERVGVEAGECVQFKNIKCNVPDGTLILFRGFMISPNGSKSIPANAVWMDNPAAVAVCEIDTELPPSITAEVEE